MGRGQVGWQINSRACPTLSGLLPGWDPSSCGDASGSLPILSILPILSAAFSIHGVGQRGRRCPVTWVGRVSPRATEESRVLPPSPRHRHRARNQCRSRPLPRGTGGRTGPGWRSFSPGRIGISAGPAPGPRRAVHLTADDRRCRRLRRWSDCTTQSMLGLGVTSKVRGRFTSSPFLSASSASSAVSTAFSRFMAAQERMPRGHRQTRPRAAHPGRAAPPVGPVCRWNDGSGAW